MNATSEKEKLAYLLGGIDLQDLTVNASYGRLDLSKTLDHVLAMHAHQPVDARRLRKPGRRARLDVQSQAAGQSFLECC